METTTGATVPVPTQAEEQEDQKVLKILEDLKKEGFYLSKKGIHEILNSYEEMPSLDEIKKAIINVSTLNTYLLFFFKHTFFLSWMLYT